MKNLQMHDLRDRLETCEQCVYMQRFADMNEQPDLTKDEIAELRRGLDETERKRARSKLRPSKAVKSTQMVEQ